MKKAARSWRNTRRQWRRFKRFVYFIVKIHLFLNEKLSFIFYPIQNIVSRLTSDLVWWRDHWKSRVGKLMQS
jgi:hypothetical protein